MSTYIEALDSCFTIARDDMPRAASLLPERYRDLSKPPLDQVACALRDCGFTAYTSGGALDALGCEFGELYGSVEEVLTAIAPAVEDGSYFTYLDCDVREPVGFFFDHGVCEFKAGRLVFD